MYIIIAMPVCENYDTRVTSKSYNSNTKIRKTLNLKQKYYMMYKSFSMTH